MTLSIRIHTSAQSRDEIRFLLGRLVDVNEYLIRRRRLPPLYESGIRYVREHEDYVARRPVEDWQAADVLVATKRGDCEDLACYRCAELRLKGVDAHPRLTRTGRVWHITVAIRERGKPLVVEDPSKLLGMKGVA